MTKQALPSSTDAAKPCHSLEQHHDEIGILPFHPLANLFELLNEKELDELAGDIQRRGQRFPITTYQGEIIDGRNRAIACARVGIEPKYTEFDGQEKDIPRFIIGANILRRHLTPKQRRDLIKRFLQSDPTKSDRQIAEETKSNRNTVGRVRAALEKSGDVSRVTREPIPEAASSRPRRPKPTAQPIHQRLPRWKRPRPKCRRQS
jgi:ParB-like chromosome segregation protein Spo0J